MGVRIGAIIMHALGRAGLITYKNRFQRDTVKVNPRLIRRTNPKDRRITFRFKNNALHN